MFNNGTIMSKFKRFIEEVNLVESLASVVALLIVLTIFICSLQFLLNLVLPAILAGNVSPFEIGVIILIVNLLIYSVLILGYSFMGIFLLINWIFGLVGL